jgi:hypothetical protein
MVRKDLYKNKRDRSNGRLTKQLDLSIFSLPRADLMGSTVKSVVKKLSAILF